MHPLLLRQSRQLLCPHRNGDLAQPRHRSIRRQDIAVASTANPASGGRYGNAGYNRAHFWTGLGTLVVTVSTHPHSELQVTV
jgi:hypothetical protein